MTLCDVCHRDITVEPRGGDHPSPGDHDPAFHVAKAYGTFDITPDMSLAAIVAVIENAPVGKKLRWAPGTYDFEGMTFRGGTALNLAEGTHDVTIKNAGIVAQKEPQP